MLANIVEKKKENKDNYGAFLSFYICMQPVQSAGQAQIKLFLDCGSVPQQC